MQLGLTSIIPLASLYALEHGAATALWRMAHMIVTFGPVFFMFEIATKAFYFDNALAFGKSSYMATGRDFVLKHSSFPENYIGTVQSHLYLGFEALALLFIATIFGTFRSALDYLFFFLAGWAFSISLVGAPFW